MKYDSDAKNAMILPLPTPRQGSEDAVRFVDLSKYDSFFKDLNRGFPIPKVLNAIAPPSPSRAGFIDSRLVVHRVGSFDASFVPSMDDFDRLDPRFTIPKDVWSKLPEYKDWGFAVFQLHELSGEPHPMAFEFKTRMPDKVFFPTVHIHDGQVHATEYFDHALYLQHPELDADVGAATGIPDPRRRLIRSTDIASTFVDVEKAKGIVDGNLLVHKKLLKGNLANKDVWIAAKSDSSTKKYGSLKTLLPLGILAPVTWIIRRRQLLQ
ncbi:MAG: hypothetical protein KDB00_21435 [Planctomycetales bacterium]|nr:hypothetical protein [Planctomycetales bacterium]